MTKTSIDDASRLKTDEQAPVIPVQTRSGRFTSTDVGDFEQVSGLESVWKFTPVAKLTSLLNDQLSDAPALSVLNATDGITVQVHPVATVERGRAGVPEERASANAWSSVTTVTSISITGSDQRITCERELTSDPAAAAHTIIEAQPSAEALVILRNRGAGALSENLEILVGAQAHLTVVSVQEWDPSTRHLASHFARLAKDASLTHIVVSLSGEVVRVNPSFHLSAPGSSIDALGAYFSTSGQHLEQQVYVDHNAPHTISRVNYKGALQGDGARSVWIGDVLIRQSATGTDSYEQNRNIVLTDGTRADSIPNLEIETGDIAGAGHASATGRFDEEHLFYLMSRGISEAEARRLVVRGFLNDVIQHVGDAELESELQASIDRTLSERVGA